MLDLSGEVLLGCCGDNFLWLWFEFEWLWWVGLANWFWLGFKAYSIYFLSSGILKFLPYLTQLLVMWTGLVFWFWWISVFLWFRFLIVGVPGAQLLGWDSGLQSTMWFFRCISKRIEIKMAVHLFLSFYFNKQIYKSNKFSVSMMILTPLTQHDLSVLRRK